MEAIGVAQLVLLLLSLRMIWASFKNIIYDTMTTAVTATSCLLPQAHANAQYNTQVSV